ncbi:MAG TPA: biotin transporter BioY [Sedimentisphaerales bacterium]|nr:biotin transporter BioY [Sedimentisphaerales bacterium]
MLSNVITYADVLRPRGRKFASYYDLTLIVGGSVVIALSARMAVMLPFSPVPVTGQTFAVLMAGALLGSRRGSLAVITYIAQGVAGLPVFALGRAGPAVLLGPTGGYLIGFIAAAYITGILAQRGWDRRVGTTILAMVLGNCAIYMPGLVWLVILTSVGNALKMGFYPFIAGDFLKIVLAAAVLPAGWRVLRYCRSGEENRPQYR